MRGLLVLLIDHSDLSRCLRADDHPLRIGVCPLHGCVVQSQEKNGIWQWVHISRCPQWKRKATALA